MVESWRGRAVRLKNAPEKPERFKAKSKPKINKKKAWRVCYKYADLDISVPGLEREWFVQSYANEKGARMAFEAKRHEKFFGPSEYRLINPAGEIVDSYRNPKRVGEAPASETTKEGRIEC